MDSNAWMSKDGGYLEVSFEKVVVPSAVKVWVTYNSKDAIQDIRLYHPDGNFTSIGEWIKYFLVCIFGTKYVTIFYCFAKFNMQ